jgi:hypothetical protein
MIRAGAYAEGTMHEQDVHLVLSWELLSKRDCMQVPVLFDKKTKTIVSNESACLPLSARYALQLTALLFRILMTSAWVIVCYMNMTQHNN